ncbi:hypothetical protein [uncultured Faecalibaculum sp.]|uniref:hypothetical protein n=1 Tax=uncultured Faecalibaculum sp. TaxID=1729681 RepID=UPI0026063CC5|nr:hypothetical protein [uncultured Faecalibaculum sp.]
MDFYTIVQLLANLCVIADFLWQHNRILGAGRTAITIQISIIRETKKHDQCSSTDRASDDR